MENDEIKETLAAASKAHRHAGRIDPGIDARNYREEVSETDEEISWNR